MNHFASTIQNTGKEQWVEKWNEQGEENQSETPNYM